MKAYIKIDNSNQKELGKLLNVDSERLFSERLVNYKSIDKLCFDLDMTYKVGTEINMNGNIAIVDKNSKIKYEEKPKIIYSYEPFEYIINIMKVFDNKILKYLNDKFINTIVKDKEKNQEEIYKNIFYYIYSTNSELTFDMIEIIGKYMTYFGFIRNVYNDKKLTNKCNVFELMYSFYLIYETFYLFKKLNDITEELSLSIFNLKYEKYSEEVIIDKIDYNLDYLENIDSFSYHSKFDKDNFLWKTDLLFNNSLSLVIYELRMQLSKNADVSFSICENPECLRTIVITHDNQHFCIGNKECERTRANQRKKKSRNNKKKIKQSKT